jgi:hypothetical protein
MNLLRSMDEWVLPPVADGIIRLGRGARRLRGLVVVTMLAAAAVTVASVWRLDEGPVGDVTVGDVARVGVVGGASIPDYEAQSRQELAQLLAVDPAVEVYALVTLRAYLAPERLAPVLAGAPATQVYARVPLPDLQTQIVLIPAYRVPEDVTAGMEEVAVRKDKEAADYAGLVADLSDTAGSARERELRAVYASGERIADAEAAAYHQRCSCVYAAVVRASPTALDVIAHREAVRSVDPAPEVRRLDRAVFLPPMPEQRLEAGPPDATGQPAAVLTTSPTASSR